MCNAQHIAEDRHRKTSCQFPLGCRVSEPMYEGWECGSRPETNIPFGHQGRRTTQHPRHRIGTILTRQVVCNDKEQIPAAIEVIDTLDMRSLIRSLAEHLSKCGWGLRAQVKTGRYYKASPSSTSDLLWNRLWSSITKNMNSSCWTGTCWSTAHGVAAVGTDLSFSWSNNILVRTGAIMQTTAIVSSEHRCKFTELRIAPSQQQPSQTYNVSVVSVSQQKRKPTVLPGYPHSINTVSEIVLPWYCMRIDLGVQLEDVLWPCWTAGAKLQKSLEPCGLGKNSWFV